MSVRLSDGRVAQRAALRKRQRARRHSVLAGSVVLLLAGVVAVGSQTVWNRVNPGTYVAGIPVGGLSRSQLRAALAGPISARLQRTLRVLIGDRDFDLQPEQAGLRLDPVATEQELFGHRARNLADRIRALPGRRRDVPPVIAVDPAALAATLQPELIAVSPRQPARTVLLAPSPVLWASGNASFRPSGAGLQQLPRGSDAGATGVADLAPQLDALRVALAGADSQVRLPMPRPRTSTPALPAGSMLAPAGVDQLVGSYTTSYLCCQARVRNIRRIGQLVDRFVIPPGAVFSLNRTVGRRTPGRGFVPAPALEDGDLVNQLGGGVSQFSTTLFNAAWFAGLPIVEHKPHSMYLNRYPPGREATLDYDSVDQKILNNTRAPIVIRVTSTDTRLTVALYGHTGDRAVASTSSPRRPHRRGFSISVRRTVWQDAHRVGSTLLRWTYSGIVTE